VSTRSLPPIRWPLLGIYLAATPTIRVTRGGGSKVLHLVSRPRSPAIAAARRSSWCEPFAADGRTAALDGACAQRGDDFVRCALGDLDEREAVGDLDRTDIAAADAGFVGDRADEVLRTDAGPRVRRR
jgi:hypothetical protein